MKNSLVLKRSDMAVWTNLFIALLLGIAIAFLSGCASAPTLPLASDGSQIIETEGGAIYLPQERYKVTEVVTGGFRIWDKENSKAIFVATNKAAVAKGYSSFAAPWGFDISSSEMVSKGDNFVVTKEKIKLSGGCSRMMMKAVNPGFTVLEYSDKSETTSGESVTALLSRYVPGKASVAEAQ